MLSFLKIENLAIVPSLSVEFGPGFNVLTGETGAGKSIIVDAVGLLLGERASSDMVRTGADRLTVEGLFEISGRTRILADLRGMGIEAGEEGIVLRREVTAAGRSRAFLNGTLVPLQQLKQIGDQIADLHGQNPHQSLLRAEAQREALDHFAGAGPVCAKVAKAATEFRKLTAERDRLRESRREQVRISDALRAEISEIEVVSPSAEEEGELRREEALLRHAEEVRTLAESACDLLNEDDASALSRLGSIREALSRLAAIDTRCNEPLRAVEESIIGLTEALRAVEPYRDQEEFDPARQETVAARLADLDRLKRKYGHSVDEILAYLERARRDLRSLEGAGDRLEGLDASIAASAERYGKLAEKLSERRSEAAQSLVQALKPELKALSLAGCRFEVAFEPHEEPGSEILAHGRRVACRKEGAESVEFLISPNPGEDLRALSRIASGGELSRLMLALRTASESRADMRTLIFDEVDAGIGGTVAEAVASRLKALSRKQQVLCVTHLPQVAAAADRHYRVEKRNRGGRTRTAILKLEASDRVDELARMLGSPAAPTARRHAATLIGGRKRT